MHGKAKQGGNVADADPLPKLAMGTAVSIPVVLLVEEPAPNWQSLVIVPDEKARWLRLGLGSLPEASLC